MVVTDAFAKAGLEIPLLTERSYQEFASFFTIIGSSYRNPLDISSNLMPMDNIIRCVDILNEDENVDSVILELSVAFLTRIARFIPIFFDELIDALALYKTRCNKPFLTILVSAHAETEALEARQKLVERGIPSFPSFERGAKALKKVVEYYRFQSL